MQRSTRRRLRRQVRDLLRELEITAPLDVAELCRRLGAHRGRRIVLKATTTMPMTAAYAMWLSTDDVDYVLFQQQTSPLHRRHLVLHELGHMIAGHGGDGTDGLSALMPSLSPQLITAALGRHAYDTEQEREAEYIASTILRWAADLEVQPFQPVEVPAAADRALNDQRGWM